MSTIPTTQSGLPTSPRPTGSQAGTGAAAAGASSIDPIKLLNKHKWLLLGAGVLGGFAGAGANYALEEISPVWKPVALFQCTGQITNITDTGSSGNNDIEMNRFMQTEIRKMTSEALLQRVVEDPALQQNAKAWCVKFMRASPGSTEKVFDQTRALRRLKEYLAARIITNTSLIELSYSGSQREDSTYIVGLVKEKYMAALANQGQLLQDDRTKSLSDAIARSDTDISALEGRRKRLIENNRLESVDERVSANQTRLLNINEELLGVEGNLRSLGKRLEMMKGEMDNPAGFVFSADLQEQVDHDPLIQDIKGRISRIEDELKTMLNMGKSREHREYKAMEARLASTKQNLEDERTRLHRQMFDSELDKYSKQIKSLEAQQIGLITSRDEASKRQVELTQLQTEVADITAQIESVNKNRASTNDQKQTIISLSQLATANRVQVYQPERLPLELSFPQLKFMIPLGIVLGMGLLGGIVFLREIVDQRVKGPSDINLMPRMKLLGWVPDAAEDPEGTGAAETAFRDRPRGIVAESFRQLRSTLSKRLDQAGHKTVLVMSGMPGSGASSVTANLALAMAAADKRVLVIDANFRRPAQHRVFGVQESPGLADVLSGTKTLDTVVQHSSTPNVDVLAVGSKELRIVERLAAQAKGDVLAKVKADYDIVLIDVAPAVVAGDGLALAQRVDASILVVRAMSDKRGMVARIRNELSDSRSEFLGVVVNGVRASAGGYMKGNIRAASQYAKA